MIYMIEQKKQEQNSCLIVVSKTVAIFVILVTISIFLSIVVCTNIIVTHLNKNKDAYYIQLLNNKDREIKELQNQNNQLMKDTETLFDFASLYPDIINGLMEAYEPRSEE